MKRFDCSCGATFIVGKKRVYGPLYSFAHFQGLMMEYETFEAIYGDCARELTKKRG